MKNVINTKRKLTLTELLIYHDDLLNQIEEMLKSLEKEVMMIIIQGHKVLDEILHAINLYENNSYNEDEQVLNKLQKTVVLFQLICDNLLDI